MNYGESSEETPLLKYSEDCERASFIDDDDEESMPRKKGTRKGKRKQTRKSGSRKGKQAKGVRFIKGRVALHVAGLGLQRLGVSELVRHISLSKLKSAAKKFLQSKGVVTKRRKVRRKKAKR